MPNATVLIPRRLRMSLRLLLPKNKSALLDSWPREPRVYHRGVTELDRAVPLSLMDEYVSFDLLSPQYVAAVKDGQAVHPGRFSRDGKMIPGKLQGLAGQGYTLNLREIQRTIPYLAGVSRDIQSETGCANYAAAIITPPGKQGLRHHWDQWTGVITQLAGRKRWPLWRPVVEYPMGAYMSSPEVWTPELTERFATTPPDVEFELSPGDTLVVPRGWVHNPYSVSDDRSYHLTFALHERTRLWVAEKLIGLAIKDAHFRAEVPPSAFARETEAEIRKVRSLVIGFLRQADTATAAELIRKAAETENA
ncbi:JmjC domain-containing protein [Peterkaempfera bronchialis]|uniref:JmjC domain-containing protein n=1 Tax=Peterkaempfera bronchialis TaxID=2126346 RepID=UPI003C2E448F